MPMLFGLFKTKKDKRIEQLENELNSSIKSHHIDIKPYKIHRLKQTIILPKESLQEINDDEVKKIVADSFDIEPYIEIRVERDLENLSYKYVAELVVMK